MDHATCLLTKEGKKQEHGCTAIQQPKHQITKFCFRSLVVCFGDGQHLIRGQKFVNGHGKEFRDRFQRLDIGVAPTGFPL